MVRLLDKLEVENESDKNSCTITTFFGLNYEELPVLQQNQDSGITGRDIAEIVAVALHREAAEKFVGGKN